MPCNVHDAPKEPAFDGLSLDILHQLENYCAQHD
jgi:hypothetical protein